MSTHSDTLTLLLCSRVHEDLPVKQRAVKVSKMCKLIRDRTANKNLENACRTVIKATQEGRYNDVIRATSLAENNYFGELV